MTNIVKFDAPELQAIEPSRAEQIRATFEPMADMLSKFEDTYNGVLEEANKGITYDVTSKAKRLRIDIGRVRIETGKLKDQQKSEYLRASNAIQAVHNILVWAVTDKENKLKNIENHFEIQEKKRLEDLQRERVDLLLPYVDDAAERVLSGMDLDVWAAYLSTKKREYEDRIDAERKAEADRIAIEKAEAEERERIRVENERLKTEAADREKAAEAERKRQAEILQKERDAAAAKQKAIENAARIAHEKAEAERKRLESELKAKQDAENKAAAVAAAKAASDRKAKEQAAKAPDKNKLAAFVDAIELPETPKLSTQEADAVLNELLLKFKAYKNWANEQIKTI